MQETAKYLCENIQGCKIAYTQSDEITLVLVDYQSREASAWFDSNIQKMVSVSASMATLAFNKSFAKYVQKWMDDYFEAWNHSDWEDKYLETLEKRVATAMFDSRVFTLPKEEVVNCLIWRQQDATRNSIQMVGQANFSHNELHGKSCNMIQDMLHEQRGINWNDFPTHKKRGSCVIKRNETTTYVTHDENGNVTTGSSERPHWVIDTEIPIFKGEGREYIDKLIRVGCNCQCKTYIN